MWTKSCLILGLVGTSFGLELPCLNTIGGLIKEVPCKPDQRATGWGYTEEDGPETWAANFPEFCAGMSQSPIDIDTTSAVKTDPGPIVMTGWEQLMPGNIANNGHSLVFSFLETAFEGDDLAPPTITGGRLGAETYQFLSLHWHWGAASTGGSEHTKDGMAYPLEMHMVHVNTKYGAEYADYADGLAVLGFFFEVSTEDNGQLSDLLGSVNIMRFLNKNKRRKGGRANVWENAVGAEVRLSQMVNAAGVGDNYYYYSGSLTTPMCNEVVQWTNYETTIPISEDQLEIFRGLMDSEGAMFNDNFRPAQPLNGRTVNMRTPMTDTDTTDAADATSAALTAGTVGGIVIGAGAVLVLSAIAPLLAPSRTARTGGSAVVQRTKHLSQVERLLRAGQEMFGFWP